MTELDQLLLRERACSRIVEDTLAGRAVQHDDRREFLRARAVFWEQDHVQIGYGQHVPSIVDMSMIEYGSALNQLKEINEDRADNGRVKFGSIPVRSVTGEQVFAITQFCWILGDSLREFSTSIDEFRAAAAKNGWLISQDRYAADVMPALDEHTALELASCHGE